MNTQSINTIVLILGDQLSPEMTSLRKTEQASTLVVMGEIKEEASYVWHHKKKLAFVFSAMRHFRDELIELGWRVDYLKYGEATTVESITDLLERALDLYPAAKVVVTEPGEYRLAEMLKGDLKTSVAIEILPDERFICSSEKFGDWVRSRKLLRMEYFYRDMRRETGLLMDGEKPIGGKWNYDTDNRHPANQGLIFKQPKKFENDQITLEVLDLIRREFAANFGELEPFWFATSRVQAEAAWQEFLVHSLPQFGDYQDAMLRDEKFLFHSVISHYLNIGLLDALDICKQVEEKYLNGQIPLNAAEGFIRQIIGWREYVRGIYWWRMPDYLDENYFSHNEALPDFYWTADTELKCLADSIGQTKKEAYAHHIQRLMLTGNFAMLIGVNPKLIHEWYLAVYADAYEWVELPNTLGMSQFADGGLLGSKPYAASGNYINKMSDYCSACKFKVKEKVGDSACPFNYLYWNFLIRNRNKLEHNQRLKLAYRSLDKMTVERVGEITASATEFIRSISAPA